MKLLHITPDFPSEYFIGGQGAVVQRISRHLVSKGISVTVLTAQRSASTLSKILKKREHIDDVAIVRVATAPYHKRFFGVTVPPPVLTVRGLMESLPFIARADLVHFHNFWYGGFLLPLFFAAKLLGKKIVFTPYYEDCARTNPRETRMFYRFIELMARAAHATTVISEQEKCKLLEFTDRIVKIPLGLDPGHPAGKKNSTDAPSPEPDLILTVGNVCERKNIHTLLEALAHVSQPWKLIIKSAPGADAHYTRLCREKAGTLGLADRIAWITQCLDEGELYDLYSRAALFVMPSTWESFGLSALEAISCRIPAILSTGCMIIEYFTPGEDMLVVQPSDVKGWAAAIQSLLRDKDYARRLAASAKRKVSTYFTWERVADDYIKVYNAVIRGERIQSVWNSIDPSRIAAVIAPGANE